MNASGDELKIIQLDYTDLPTSRGKRRIAFVAAQSHDASTDVTSKPDSKLVGDSYLDLVLSSTGKSGEAKLAKSTLCQVCELPLASTSTTVAHESSIAHQVCLKHSHPPSSIDRTRKGLAYLQSYGWDPDSRSGLGASREGILFPIKALEKKDHAGIGAQTKEARAVKPPPNKVKRMNAKHIRKMAADEKVKRERLHRMFYTDDEVEKYLGPNA